MRRLLTIFLFATIANAQWYNFCTQTASSNLCNAMNGKINAQYGTSLPGTCTASLDFYINSSTGAFYYCSSTNNWTTQTIGQAPVFASYASRGSCSSSNTGQMFFASELSNKKWICDGSTWQPVAFDMQVVEPTALSWTATGSSTVPAIASVAGALIVTASTSGNWQVAATPISLGTPYTIEVAFTFAAQFNGTFDGCGLVLFSSTPPVFSGPTWMAWFVGSKPNTGVILPPTTLDFFDEYGDNMGQFSGQQVAPVIRAKLVDDGTNRTFYLNNGAGYFQAFQQSDAAGNTPHNPGYWGVGCGTGSGEMAQLVLYSASVHH